MATEWGAWPGQLVSGRTVDELAKAAQAQTAVGFVMPSGLDRLEGNLKEFLQRGRLRLLAGDYLGVTEPDALVRLLDLEGERQRRA